MKNTSWLTKTNHFCPKWYHIQFPHLIIISIIAATTCIFFHALASTEDISRVTNTSFRARPGALTWWNWIAGRLANWCTWLKVTVGWAFQSWRGRMCVSANHNFATLLYLTAREIGQAIHVSIFCRSSWLRNMYFSDIRQKVLFLQGPIVTPRSWHSLTYDSIASHNAEWAPSSSQTSNKQSWKKPYTHRVKICKYLLFD